jgi:hypothetical protein
VTKETLYEKSSRSKKKITTGTLIAMNQDADERIRVRERRCLFIGSP